MNKPQALLAGLAIVSSALADEPLPKVQSVTWEQLCLGKLPATISYQDVIEARYAHLGFKPEEINQILTEKESLRSTQSGWPMHADYSKQYPVGVQELPEGLKGKHTWPADQVILSSAVINKPEVALVLQEELLHAVQRSSESVVDQVFVPLKDTDLFNRLEQYRERLDSVNQQLDKLDPNLRKLPFQELTLTALAKLDEQNDFSQKASELIFDFFGESEVDIPIEKMPIFGIGRQLEFLRKYNAPPSLIKELEQLEKSASNSALLHNNLAHKAALVAQVYRDLLGSRYSQIYIEIEPRLSDVAFTWMSHQKESGQKITAILTPAQAKEAFEWFMKQEFPKTQWRI